MLGKRVSRSNLCRPLGAGSRRSALLTGAALGMVLLSAQHADAQASPPAPVFPMVDERGVNLASGQLVLSFPTASVGPADEGLVWQRYRVIDNLGVRDVDSFTGVITGPGYGTPGELTISFGRQAVIFKTQDGGAPYEGVAGADGQTLTYDPNTKEFTYTLADGTRAYFSALESFYGAPRVIRRMVKPNGEIINWTYRPVTTSLQYAINAVSSSLGYMVKYEYFAGTNDLKKVTALNLTHTYCNPNGDACDSAGWQSVTFSGPMDGTTLTATDSLGQVTTYVWGSDGNVQSVSNPEGVTLTYDYDDYGEVTSVATGEGVWNYNYNWLPNGSQLSLTITDPLHHSKVIKTEANFGQILSFTDGRGKTTQFGILASGQIYEVDAPEGNSTFYKYKSWGAVERVERRPKGGISPAFVTEYFYDSSCDAASTFSVMKCNKPTYVIEGGVRTDFTYDPVHGGILSVTSQPDEEGNVAKTNFDYAQYQPRVLDEGGQPTSVPVWIYRLKSTSACITGATCSGDQLAITDYEYEPSNGVTNLLPSAITVHDGANELSSRTQLGFNRFGDLRTVDQPLTGTIRYRYDAMRQLVGMIEADPDGQATGKPARAHRLFYRKDGQLMYVQHGTIPSQSDADWLSSTAFDKIWTESNIFDENGRIIRSRVRTFVGGNAVDQMVTDYSYNSHLLSCAAVRMNKDAFDVRPASACSPGPEGAHGSDRITKVSYDENDRPTDVTQGVGTVAWKTESTSYTDNGLVQTVTDADGNLTTFERDSFDRLKRIRFPDPNTPGLSSTSDFVEATYDDATWRLVQLRRRDTSTVTYTYDVRGRMRTKDSPSFTEYRYDNFGRLSSATADGQTIQSAYNAFGELDSESGPLGTTSYGYDSASRRRWMRWPDTTEAHYSYNAAGALTRISEAYSGGPLFAAFDYDDLGRRERLWLGNGDNTAYGYDDLSRLISLSLDLTDNTADLQRTFDYNEAGELIERTNSNSRYNLSDLASGRTFVVNGQNRVTAIDGQSLSADGNGNVQFDGTTWFTFDEDSRLETAGALTLSYDPYGRLTQISGSSEEGTLRQLYDGANLIAEYDASGKLLRRYVYGPSVDEPLVEIEGADRSWMSADERGSISAINGPDGASVNGYGEYGLPDSGNTGRFQYTGQVRLPGTDVFYYKNRVYAPVLRRFLQVDPAGLTSGLNLYAYVGDDPLNRRDPFGLAPIEAVEEVVVTAPRIRWLPAGLRILIPGDAPAPSHEVQVGELVITGTRAKTRSGVTLSQAVGAAMHKNLCRTAAFLPGNRIRFGGDFIAGIGPMVDGGIGLSLEDDGRVVFDAYGTVFGAAVGGLASAGLTLDDNSTPDGPSGQSTGLFLQGGAIWFGGGVALKQFDWNAVKASGSFGMGKAGLVLGWAQNATYGKTLWNLKCGGNK